MVKEGIKYKKKIQVRSGGEWVPKYAGVPIVSRRTAYRYIPVRGGMDRPCWCTNWFAEGTIKRVIEDYGDVGDYGEETYPDYCNSDDMAVKNYIGIRYEVKLCQGRTKKTYICLPSDFAEYAVKDKVIVFMRGKWDKETKELTEPDRLPGISCRKVSCKACKGNRRPDWIADEPDGTFLIMPLEIEGVNVRKEI